MWHLLPRGAVSLSEKSVHLLSLQFNCILHGQGLCLLFILDLSPLPVPSPLREFNQAHGLI